MRGAPYRLPSRAPAKNSTISDENRPSIAYRPPAQMPSIVSSERPRVRGHFRMTSPANRLGHPWPARANRAVGLVGLCSPPGLTLAPPYPGVVQLASFRMPQKGSSLPVRTIPPGSRGPDF